MYTARKYSLYTGKALSIAEKFDIEEQAIEFIKGNQSYSGSFQWVLRKVKVK